MQAVTDTHRLFPIDLLEQSLESPQDLLVWNYFVALALMQGQQAQVPNRAEMQTTLRLSYHSLKQSEQRLERNGWITLSQPTHNGVSLRRRVVVRYDELGAVRTAAELSQEVGSASLQPESLHNMYRQGSSPLPVRAYTSDSHLPSSVLLQATNLKLKHSSGSIIGFSSVSSEHLLSLSGNAPASDISVALVKLARMRRPIEQSVEAVFTAMFEEGRLRETFRKPAEKYKRQPQETISNPAVVELATALTPTPPKEVKRKRYFLSPDGYEIPMTVNDDYQCPEGWREVV